MISKETKDKMTREQWILVKTVSNAIMTLNAIFCDGALQDEIDMIAQGIAEECPGIMPLEDIELVIANALERKREILARDGK